jgi:hypothetical protein
MEPTAKRLSVGLKSYLRRLISIVGQDLLSAKLGAEPSELTGVRPTSDTH